MPFYLALCLILITFHPQHNFKRSSCFHFFFSCYLVRELAQVEYAIRWNTFSLSLVYVGFIFCFSLARKLFQHHSSEFSERYSSYSLLIDSTYKHRMRDWEKKGAPRNRGEDEWEMGSETTAIVHLFKQNIIILKNRLFFSTQATPLDFSCCF